MGFDPLPPGYWSCSGDSAMHFRNKLQIIPNLVGVMSNFRTPNLDPERPGPLCTSGETFNRASLVGIKGLLIGSWYFSMSFSVMKS